MKLLNRSHTVSPFHVLIEQKLGWFVFKGKLTELFPFTMLSDENFGKILQTRRGWHSPNTQQKHGLTRSSEILDSTVGFFLNTNA